MWIEKRGQQHRVYYRTRNEDGPKKAFEPFSTRDRAASPLPTPADARSGGLHPVPRYGLTVDAWRTR